MLGVCYIIGAGDCQKIDFVKNTDDLVICADGGLKYAEKFGIEPDLIVGDFDSYGKIPEGKSVITLPKEKDETDTHFALKKGLESGYTDFRLYGVLGGRIDHSIANIQLLVYILNKGGKAALIGDDYYITAIKNSEVILRGEKGKYVSVFSFSPESKGVFIKGLKYEVKDFILSSDNPMGVSNEFTENDASIEVKDGTLIIMIEK